MANIAFLHAHPDDEVIFTGGAITKLAALGHDVSVVFATSGELGLDNSEQALNDIRRAEAENSCEILGVKNIGFLGYHDSGFESGNFPENAFATANVEQAAEKLAQYLSKWNVDTIAFDDLNGIYGHRDHQQSNKVGSRAAELAGITEMYEFTVDREQLHFLVSVKHVVHSAFDEFDFGSAKMRALQTGSGDEYFGLGSTSIEITHTIPINGESILNKRKAMLAHTSQMPESVTKLDDTTFEQAYGLEWFKRVESNLGNKALSSVLDPISLRSF